MATLNSIPENRISKQFLLKVLLQQNKLVVKTKGFGGFYFHSTTDQNAKIGTGNIDLGGPEQASANSLFQGMKDKRKAENHQERVFVGEFTYETLPSQCRVWFNDINEIYETLIDQEATQIFRTMEGLEVRLRIVIEKNQKSFVRINKFVLRVDPSEEEWEQELVKIQPLESENSELSSNDILQKNTIEVKSSSSNSKENEEPLKNNKKTMAEQQEADVAEEENILNEISKGSQNEIKELRKQLNHCFSMVEEAKNNTDSLKQFVSCFMSKIQVKWESVMKELGDVRQTNKNLQRKYEKFKEMAKAGLPRQLKFEEKAKEIKVDYKFSEKNKHQDIKVCNKNKVKCFSQDSSFKIIMIEPTTFLTKRNPFNNYFQLNLKINCIQSYIAVGVCEKEVVKALKFKQFETDVKGHGCYLLDWNGECWSNYRPENRSKPNKALKFKQNDVISLVFQSNRKMLRVSKLGKEEGKNFVNMLIDPIVPLNELCFCVFMSGNGDEVEIIDRQTPAVIDLEQQEPSAEERP